MDGEAVYEHDCETCVSLGHHQGHDLYWCDQQGIPTVIARWGDEPGDYLSGMPLAEVNPALAEAKRRAKDRGLATTRLEAENERLRAFARDARALAYSGDCDACGATDLLLELVDKHGIDGP